MKTLVAVLPILLGTGYMAMQYHTPLDEDFPTVAVVFGYHFFLTENIGPEHYASNIAAILTRFSDLKCIVLSGANTRPGHSTRSEALVLKSTLQRLGIRAPIVLDENARTTIENLQNSADLVAAVEWALPSRTQIVLFSDSFQRPRIWWYAKRFFPGKELSLVGIPLWRERLQWQMGIR